MPQFSYYIDASCEAKCRQVTGQSFETFFKRAQKFASHALARIQNPNDTDFARVYNVIMKAPKSDGERLGRARIWQARYRDGFQNPNEYEPTVKHVLRDLSLFANSFRVTSDRHAANIRFFSDDRRRWQSVGFDGHGQELHYDTINHIIHAGNWSALKDGQAFRAGLLPDRRVPDGENPCRWVIDVGDAFWRDVEDEMSFVRQRHSGLARTPINDLIVSSLSRLILHEVMHAPPFYLDDVPHQGETSTWEVVMASKKGDAHRNAESMALLGLWAFLADTRPPGHKRGGYSIDRNWDRIPGANQDIKNDFDDDDLDEEERQAGVIFGGQSSQKWMSSKHNYAVQGVMVPYVDLT